MIRSILRIPFVLFVLVAGALAYRDYQTWQTEIEEPLKVEIQAREQESIAKRAEVQRAQNFEQEKAAKLQELEKLAAQLEATRTEMPRNSSVPDLLKLLADMSDRTGLEFSSFKPGTPEQKEFLVMTPIDVVLKGTYVQIMTFLDASANLTRVVAAQRLKIDLPGPLRTTANVLTATAKLVTYHLDQGFTGGAPNAAPNPGEPKAAGR